MHVARVRDPDWDNDTLKDAPRGLLGRAGGRIQTDSEDDDAVIGLAVSCQSGLSELPPSVVASAASATPAVSGAELGAGSMSTGPAATNAVDDLLPVSSYLMVLG